MNKHHVSTMGPMGQRARQMAAGIDRLTEAPFHMRASVALEVLPQIGAAFVQLADRVDALTPYLDEDGGF